MAASLQEVADRLARVALSQCSHDSDPDIDEHARYDLAVLTGKFMAELRPFILPLTLPKA